MKFLKTTILALFVSTAFVACHKDHDDNSTSSSIEGKWVGSYINDASGNTFYYSFNIKSNGVIEEVSSGGTVLGEGTWQLDNSTHVFMAKYTWYQPSGAKFSVIAAYDEAGKKLDGNWGYEDNVTDGGTWQMTKQ